MKRSMLWAAVVVAMTGTALVGHSATDFVKSGPILAGSPTTFLIDTAELKGDCGIGRNAPNVDSAWVTLPEGSGGLGFTLTATDALGSPDIDAYFLDAGCNFLDFENVEGDEAGTVPAGAVYADVALFSGLQATYTLTVTGALP